MEGLNKFKVLTVVVVFLFLFVVAAIYTNTKDASQGKIDVTNQAKAEKFKEDIKSDVANSSANSQDVQNVNDEVNNINMRLDSLSARIDQLEAGAKPSCYVYGIMGDNGVEQLSAESAISEARDNNRELVMTCSF